MPGHFQIAKLFGPSYSLRCLVFHHISREQSPFTAGINVTITPEEFKDTLQFIVRHYSPVSLDAVLNKGEGRMLPERAILVTFDDAYASVAEFAAPLCYEFGVPAVFFVNAAFVDNQRLAPDNLVCYLAATFGMEMINNARRRTAKHAVEDLRSISEVFGKLLPALSLQERDEFLDALRELAGINEYEVAARARLYITREHLSAFKAYGVEIGNHTYSHMHCRQLSKPNFAREIDRNKTELEAIAGTRVRSFSVPYGSPKDLTQELAEHLEASGYEAVFLSESVANCRDIDPFQIDRVSLCSGATEALFSELEVLPRLRAQRNLVLSTLHKPKGVESTRSIPRGRRSPRRDGGAQVAK
jgi:peptidoglycan/xylan/chitin deacetylase (PgdA/CDA1 family)